MMGTEDVSTMIAATSYTGRLRMSQRVFIVRKLCAIALFAIKPGENVNTVNVSARAVTVMAIAQASRITDGKPAKK
jgi:hypothetical protein